MLERNQEREREKTCKWKRACVSLKIEILMGGVKRKQLSDLGMDYITNKLKDSENTKMKS